MTYSSVFKFLFFWLLAVGPALGQILVPTHLSTALSKPTAKVGEEVELIINARIDEKWHLYATDFSEDVGPVVFTLTLAPSPAYQVVGEPKSIKSHHEQDPVFKGEVAFFEKTGQIRQRVKLLQVGPLTIKATADYQSCTSVDGRCVPGSDALTFGPLTVAAAGGTAAAKAVASAATPTPPAAAKPAAAVAAAGGPAPTPPTGKVTSASQEGVGSASSVAAPVPTPPSPANAAPAETPASGLATAAAAVATARAVPSASIGLWQYLALAFGAGLLAVLMPCVYPLLPMTVSFFTNSGGSRAQGVAKALVYGLSIIAIYTGAGVLLSALFGADAGNVISSHWLPNVLSFVIFVAFGLSFLGLFEISAPAGLVNKVDAQADKGGWSGLFFMAATLVLVSFSCTVPFVGSVAIASAGGELLRPTLGMMSFATAFALPFVLFALFPGWLKTLPRSGGWLNTLKVVLGFLELALAFKFLSSADLSYHWGLLPRGVFITIWAVLAGLLGFYLLGKIRLPHDSESTHVSVPRLVLSGAAFVFMLYLLPGLFGAPLTGLSALVPPPSRHDFTLAAGALPAPQTAGVAVSNVVGNSPLCETPRYADKLELPLGLNGYFDLKQALKCAKEQNKPVFVDFTGHNCGNCRLMEASVWSDEQVLRRLRDKYIVVALYVDDKTELPQADWYTSARDNRLKKSLGEQNLDYSITRFGVNAQPYYVLLAPDGTSLNTPVAYEPDVAKFVGFLDEGLRQHQQRPAVARR
ncbi:cytochrome c biogenesis protein CcdA [uncultured Hymenobacter sp.]|uniref:protein-disulfide reductase DsbD family protein n=1 Tax=uncultured Hymenobacter sp. TaxID=170016 RepID=UPI0035CA61CC